MKKYSDNPNELLMEIIALQDKIESDKRRLRRMEKRHEAIVNDWKIQRYRKDGSRI